MNGSFLVHIPILQPFVHWTFFLELRKYDNEIQDNKQSYTKFATDLESNQKSLDENVEDAFQFGRTNRDENIKKNTLLATFLELKLLEAFLEAGPQLAFQITVILQDGISNPIQIVTIVTSALSLTWASSELFLKYPTEVITYLEFVEGKHN